ncbi:hypothetical protein Ancab_002896 [Ancistrocladus abbreviatus]
MVCRTTLLSRKRTGGDSKPMLMMMVVMTSKRRKIVMESSQERRRERRISRSRRITREGGLLSFGYKRGVRRAKRVVLFPFLKFQRLITRNRSRRSSSSSHVHSPNSNLPSTSTGVGGFFCCFCMSQPQTMGTTAVDGPLKESNSIESETSIEFCRVLIEKNDFYAKECNTHFTD